MGWVPLLVLLVSCPANGEMIARKVVHVADGDTITVLTVDNQQHRIRIAGIDAPEKGQPFGERSRQNLSRLALGKDATLQCHKIDRYQRKVCKVMVQPSDCSICAHTLDVGLAQITVGLAWWYRAYAMEQSPEDRGRYETNELEARARGRGLWKDKAPVAPWDWRKTRRAPRTGSQSKQGGPQRSLPLRVREEIQAMSWQRRPVALIAEGRRAAP